MTWCIEAFIALLGGVGYGVWSVAFRGQAGPLSAEQYLWQLSAPLGVAFAIVQALLFVATYFVARRISQWRWRHVLGKSLAFYYLLLLFAITIMINSYFVQHKCDYYFSLFSFLHELLKQMRL